MAAADFIALRADGATSANIVPERKRRWELLKALVLYRFAREMRPYRCQKYTYVALNRWEI